MLVLTRLPEQGLVIGDEIRVTVLGIQGNQVKLGICAPKDISVHRDEIYARIQAAKKIPLAQEQATISAIDALSKYQASSGLGSPASSFV